MGDFFPRILENKQWLQTTTRVFKNKCCSFAAKTAQTGKMAWRIMTHAKATTNTRNRRLTKSFSGKCFWAPWWCPGSHQHLNRDPDVLIDVHCVRKGRAGWFPFLGGVLTAGASRMGLRGTPGNMQNYEHIYIYIPIKPKTSLKIHPKALIPSNCWFLRRWFMPRDASLIRGGKMLSTKANLQDHHLGCWERLCFPLKKPPKTSQCKIMQKFRRYIWKFMVGFSTVLVFGGVPNGIHK